MISKKEIRRDTQVTKTSEGFLYTYRLPSGDLFKRHYIGYTKTERMEDFEEDVKSHLEDK